MFVEERPLFSREDVAGLLSSKKMVQCVRQEAECALSSAQLYACRPQGCDAQQNTRSNKHPAARQPCTTGDVCVPTQMAAHSSERVRATRMSATAQKSLKVVRGGALYGDSVVGIVGRGR